jgi:hypothetical protein
MASDAEMTTSSFSEGAKAIAVMVAVSCKSLRINNNSMR